VSRPSLSVEFDRAVALARSVGNDRLVANLERLRPTLNLQGNRQGVVFADASVAFANDLVAVCRELKADPLDIILILGGVCGHVLNMLQRTGLDYQSANHALVNHLERMAERISEALMRGQADQHGG
jgi:hypothetical protein